MKQLQKFYPHLLAVIGFVIISLVYFYPVLQGKKIYQSDIAQYTGMAKEQIDFRAENNTEPYWTNSAFGGMPTYQLGAKYPNDYIGMLDDALRFLPRPADYLFLYFLGFYGLLLVFRVDPLKAFFGALAFGFSTYLIIILGVGHNAKAHAIAYMPLVIAGFILVFRKRYLHGGILTMLAVALEINANHFQMTYYLLLLLLVFSVYFVYKLYQNKELKELPKILGVFLIAVLFAIGTNATNLLATKEYADFSTRSKNELTFNPNGSKVTTDNALSREYITEYSYGIAESLNLIAPRLFGGSNAENVGTDSKLYEFIINQGASPSEAEEFAKNVPTYWGNQPIVAAPAYIGAIVFFLAILALFHDKRKVKYAFLAGAIFSLLLSWGKNLGFLTDFFIDFVPMYDKFRAVSSIQVLLELCIPVLAIMGLQSFFTEKENQWKSLKLTGIVTIGLVVLLFLAKGMFDFTTINDNYYVQAYGEEMGTAFVNALKEDRASLYSADLLRSGFFMLVAFGVLWSYYKGKLAQNTAIIIIGIFMVGDLFFVDKNYVNKEDFVSAREVDEPFQATEADMAILQDTTHYRVFEVSGNMSSARASFFHKSIGGYHAAKPRRIQQLFDYQIAKNNKEVLDMLNIKYIIQTDEKGQEFPTMNPDANGNAWFVKEVKMVNSADEEMKALDKLDSKNVAIKNKFPDSGIFKVLPKKDQIFTKDSLATIKLDLYKPNHLKYTSINSNNGFAVFSEIYYPKGWKATIDGEERPIYRVNYTLRGLDIPKGKHTIEFKFEPEVVKTGSTITLFSSIGMVLLIIGGVYFEQKGKKKE
ncbi:YfhO family protein [Flavobacterium capsici]|uniref:YfhO family protein n=1 Tax=Flavobacterium capsici TaxID=3075618 RepID=A0AA96EYF6_9FLAO|nr:MULTISPECIES: YfhO family protein [unclassified Flavobacterium]WNM17891.1 YfhO family protein [Flavobacterium sp. PMR2A8]WNM21944.1 YfhO family protein [Flavobacterium sp. PMTSA4]